MDTTIGWLKIVCLLAIALIQMGVIAWIFVCLKEANEAAKLKLKAEKLKADTLDARWKEYYMPSPKPKTWVAEVMLKDKIPCYMFHCSQDDYKPTGGVCKGKQYLYCGNGFVTTDHPATAILLQQLLNDGTLTVKPFNPDTNDLPKQ